MKVVHVERRATVTSPTGGAGIACRRIFAAQRIAGVYFQIAVTTCAEEPEALAMTTERHLFVRNLLVRAARRLLGMDFGASGLLQTGMHNFINGIGPDIVHLHWIQNCTIGVREIPKIACPIVWSLHDLWPVLGTEAYPLSDWFKKGPPETGVLNKLCWFNKKESIGGVRSRICVVGASEWVCEQARQSVVFKGCRVEKVPLPLSVDFVKRARMINDTPRAANLKFIILFGASLDYRSEIKGFDRLAKALLRLPNEVQARSELRIFGCQGASFSVGQISCSFLGRFDADELPAVYSGADVFAFPSRRETWGQTKVEALCCGTPVVAFDETACAEGIRHKETGWVAKEDNIEDFAAGLMWAYRQWVVGKRIDGEEYLNEYEPSRIGEMWKALYADVLDQKGRGIRNM